MSPYRTRPTFSVEEGGGVDHVEQGGSVRPLDIDLAEGGSIEDADGFPHRKAFAHHRRMLVLARLGVPPGTVPLSHWLEHRAVVLVPFVHRGLPHRVHQRAAIAPCECAEGDRRVGRPVGGGADLGHGLAERVGEDGEAVDVRRLALVGAHADGGVALDVLDRAEALARREPDVRRRHVVLMVDHVLGLTVAERLQPRHQPQGRDGAGFGCVDWRHRRRRAVAEACRLGRARAGGRTFREAGGEAEAATGGAGHLQRLRGPAGQEDPARLLERELAGRLAEEMHRRVPAAGNEHAVAGDAAHGAANPAIPAKRGDGDGADPLRAVGGGDHGAAVEGYAGLLQLGRQRRRRLWPAIDHGGDGAACVHDVVRRLVGVVVVGEEHRALARQRRMVVEVALRRRGQHDPGAVVVGEDQRALVGAGGEHHAARLDVPQALAAHVGGRARPQMVGAALQRAQRVVVVVTEERRAGENAHLRHGGEALCRRPGPGRAVRAIDPVAEADQRAAERRLLVHEQDPRAGLAGGERRGDSRRPAAHHEHVAVNRHLVVGVGIGCFGRAAEPRHAPDGGLVKRLPERRRPEKGLVVEAGGEERREPPGPGSKVAVGARPRIDA